MSEPACDLRRLTLLGNIIVLKSLVASQLVYTLSHLKTNQNKSTFLQPFMEWKRRQNQTNCNYRGLHRWRTENA